MAEIKLNDNFAAEVNAFRAAGKVLFDVEVSSVSGEGLSLPTVTAYQERLRKIRDLMVMFYALTNKDAKDMDALAASLKATDSGGGFR